MISCNRALTRRELQVVGGPSHVGADCRLQQSVDEMRVAAVSGRCGCSNAIDRELVAVETRLQPSF